MVLHGGVAHVRLMYHEFQVKAANFCERVLLESLSVEALLSDCGTQTVGALNLWLTERHQMRVTGRFLSRSGRSSCHFYSWKDLFKIYYTESLRRGRLQESQGG